MRSRSRARLFAMPPFHDAQKAAKMIFDTPIMARRRRTPLRCRRHSALPLRRLFAAAAAAPRLMRSRRQPCATPPPRRRIRFHETSRRRYAARAPLSSSRALFRAFFFDAPMMCRRRSAMRHVTSLIEGGEKPAATTLRQLHLSAIYRGCATPLSPLPRALFERARRANARDVY